MQETPLATWHRQHGAKMAEFGGFLMPIEYTGIIEEHRHVRQQMGLFDVSHMGEFEVSGEGSPEFLDYLVTNQPSALQVGQILYTPMCYPNGGTVDDLLVYRLGASQYFLVVNAGNTPKDWEWIRQQAASWPQVALKNQSTDTALIAIQGPESERVLAPLVSIALSSLPYYHAQWAHLGSASVLVSRTGYTGEDGFELYIPAWDALAIWEQLVDLGALPAGLGARDTLRLEARLPLYDHELTEDISPLEAGLGSFVKWDKGDFIGREALERQKNQRLSRRLVGMEIRGGIARSGYPITVTPDGPTVGHVTSGTKSPTLNRAIALALVPLDWARIGQTLYVTIRGRAVPAIIVKTPFYRRPLP